jgi:outer membrane lipoprotein SlyB
MRRLIPMAIATALATVLAGCATSSPDVVQRGDAQRMAQVEDGVVLSVRSVTVDGSQSGIGAATGGILGGIAGAAGSGVSREAQALGVLGAVAGAAVGNVIERFTTKEDAVEILVQLKDGERRAVVQAKGNETLVAGDKVTLVKTGGTVRVARAPQ